jgi:hypothetical protein
VQGVSVLFCACLGAYFYELRFDLPETIDQVDQAVDAVRCVLPDLSKLRGEPFLVYRALADERLDIMLGKEPARVEPTSLSASVGEIVRYLRQQDDVVVQQENGQFLVNGRFNLSLADLLARANRMRGRQRKPAFELSGGMPAQEKNSSTNGHPLFWEESVNSHGRS